MAHREGVGSRVRRAPQGCRVSEVKREYRANADPGATLESTDGMATQGGKAFKALRANRVTMPVPRCCTSLSPWRSCLYWLPWPASRWAGCAQPDSRFGKCTVTAGRWIPLLNCLPYEKCVPLPPSWGKVRIAYPFPHEGGRSGWGVKSYRHIRQAPDIMPQTHQYRCAGPGGQRNLDLLTGGSVGTGRRA